MNKEEHLERIKKADEAYYDGTEPIMSDHEYDILRAAYIAKYGTEDLDYVPGKPITTRKFKHPIEVTSLAKVDEDDTKKFDSEIERLNPVVAEPKYDGLTVVAYPDGNGHYFFVTRGSGIEGDILSNFRPMNKLAPPETHCDNTRYAIRGEAFMTRSAFDLMNKELVSAGKQPKVNPRNAAAGILNPARKDKSPYMAYLSYVCYDVIGMDAPEEAKLEYISKHTPFIATPCLTYKTKDSTEDIRKDILTCHKKMIEEDEIPIDGMVIKTNQEHSLEKWGNTSHHPRNAIAIKSAQSAVSTVLRNVHWQVGKTGALTPVADFDPVEILGSTVSQASLSNPEEIKRLNLHIGDDIAVIKAKEIIPKIIMSYGGGKKEIDVPTKCPSCGNSLHQNGPVLYCENPNCREVMAQKLAFMASKKALDIPGLSIETCRQMVNHPDGEVTLDDILWADKEDYLVLDGVRDKKAQKLSDGMKHAMETPHAFANWLSALCIDGVGHSVANVLLKHYGSVAGVKAALIEGDTSREELEEIPGIGKIMAEILLSDSFKSRWEWLEKNFPIKEDKIEVNLGKTLPFTDKNFVLTGKMPHPRSYYEEIIKKNGGTIASSVTKKTNYLVIADVNSISSKAQKARKLGTKLISPEQLESKSFD